MKDILEFSGEYRFLSNFYPSKVTYNNIDFSYVETAFVAAKTLSTTTQLYISGLKPYEAKKYGRMIELRPDWNTYRLEVMKDLLRQKFQKGSEPGNKLEETGDCQLVEGNWWHDTFWGVCNGFGENNLGKLLMKIREELKND